MKKHYIVEADILRILAVLGVIFVHAFYPVYGRHDFLGGSGWWLATVMHSAGLASVPLFIMLSGYFMLSKERNHKDMLQRVFNRLLIPLAIWFPIYIWWNNYIWGRKQTPLSIMHMISSGSMYHLYFLVILVGLYILTPWIRRLLGSNNSELKFSQILFWSVAVGMYGSMYLGLLRSPAMNAFTWWLPFLGYYIAGHLLRNISSKQAKLAGVSSIVWLICTIILSYAGVEMKLWNLNVLWHNSGIYYFNTFLSPNIIAMSISFYVWFMFGIDWDKVKLRGWLMAILRQLAAASYGVFIIHVMVMDYLDIRYGYAIEFLTDSVRAFLIDRTILIVLISFMIAVMLRKTPFMRKVVGE